MQSRNIYDKKKVQSNENILTIVCLSRELYKIKDTRYYREISRRNETLRAFPSTLFKSCSTWRRCLPELGSQDAARPVRSFVWPSCIVQLNLKPEAPLSALLPTNNEIERDSWEDVSTIEVFYQQGKSKIFISPRLKTYELKRHVQYKLYSEPHSYTTLFLPILLKNILEENLISISTFYRLISLYFIYIISLIYIYIYII